jgi:tetratricopeptide (TPR) repeat protein
VNQGSVKVMHIGRYLKKKRIESNLTQEDLARSAEVDVKTIYRIEKNAKPTLTKTNKTYSKIFDKLGISISDRQLIMSMISFDIENQLNPMEMLVKLSSKGTQDILRKLEENLVKAYEFSKIGEYHDALDIYLAFAKIYPSEFVFLGCASMYEIIGEYEKAIEYSDKVLSMEIYQYEALYIKGTCLGSLNHYDEAIKVLENALKINNTYQIHYNLGVTNWYKHNNANALNHYNECLELNPDFASAHLNLGICYFETMYLDESLHHIDEAIRLEPDMYQAYGRKGEHYRFIEQHDKAIRYFEECLRLDQENYQALLGIAISFALKKDLSQSAIYFKKLFETYLDSFFKKGVGSKNLLIDCGYEVIRIIELNYIHQDLIEVYINGVCIPVNMNKGKSFIFIGAPPLSDETGSILYPMVGKIFQVESEFKEVTTQIQKSVELFRYFEHPLYVDVNKDIDVTITERENNVLIEMVFGGTYHIVGVTDVKSGGFQSFIEQYKKLKEFRIHLECLSEGFDITGIENVSHHLLTK